MFSLFVSRFKEQSNSILGNDSFKERFKFLPNGGFLFKSTSMRLSSVARRESIERIPALKRARALTWPMPWICWKSLALECQERHFKLEINSSEFLNRTAWLFIAAASAITKNSKEAYIYMYVSNILFSISNFLHFKSLIKWSIHKFKEPIYKLVNFASNSDNSICNATWTNKNGFFHVSQSILPPTGKINCGCVANLCRRTLSPLLKASWSSVSEFLDKSLRRSEVSVSLRKLAVWRSLSDFNLMKCFAIEFPIAVHEMLDSDMLDLLMCITPLLSSSFK